MTTAMRNTSMKLKTALILAGAVGVSAACGDFNVPNSDAPSLDALQTNPTPSVINSATQGMFNGYRASVTGNLSNVSVFAHYGREGYYIDVAQTSLTAFDVPLTPNDGAGWAITYQYVQEANTIRRALDLVGAAMTDPQKEAIRGFVKTAEAYLLHGQLRAQDSIGIAIDTDHPRSDPLPVIATRAQSFAFIIQRLDEAYASLGTAVTAGVSFPFQFPTGFAGFTTPAAFQQFNRALKARVLIETGDYAGALTALGQSFINTGSPMSFGVYNSYSTASGDQTNTFFDPNGVSFVADTMLPRQAQAQPGGSVDLRVSTKMVQMAVYRTHTRVTSNYRWTIYNSNSAPLPIIKNEELILIRAEARYRTGDVAGALADINLVRGQSGGLAALGGFATSQAFDDELLYNRKYSLLFEYGHRWVDLRRFGRLLTDLIGPRGPGDLIFIRVPLPQPECDARGGQPVAACSQTPLFRTTS
jgi:hypothetical protein